MGNVGFLHGACEDLWSALLCIGTTTGQSQKGSSIARFFLPLAHPSSIRWGMRWWGECSCITLHRDAFVGMSQVKSHVLISLVLSSIAQCDTTSNDFSGRAQ